MLISTQAIVLQSVKYGDTAAVVKMYTLQCGMLSFIVKGIYNRKRSKAALLQPLSMLHIEMQLRNNRGLQALHEIRMDAPFTSIPFSLGKTAQALFIAEVLIRAIREEERNDELFGFLHDSLCYLDQYPGELPDFHLKFLLELSRFLGFYPVDNYDTDHPYFQYTDGVFLSFAGETCLGRDASEAVNRLMRAGFGDLSTSTFNRQQRRQLTTHLLDFFRWHLPAISGLHTPDVLEEVFG